MVKFKYTILYVQDVTASILFYEKAFGFQRKFITPDNSYGELLTGDTVLSFASVELAKSNLSDGFMESAPNGKPFGIEIGFTTENVEQVFNTAVQEGGIPVEQMKVKPWGQEVAYIKDLNGFLIEICSEMAD
ncbi:VOC family protein [Pedobacter metabolipauper]|uniref:Putative glyoxalase superfamily protein PhnB n=1 Tax=Pedobacter metabolipauper TaxID=425513 RepID=A0A4R6ST82_9SPHI|nr:VOC family protein [Pedobacter metabolipauper]TDQ08218.1 putative glyoxalase superfamily protein PhnB [Pedobacter metabolipauper]